MKKCTFFGHKICPERISDNLKSVLKDMVENKVVTEFYVGNNGEFDRLVRRELKNLKTNYPDISFYVVPAYLRELQAIPSCYETLIPNGIEEALPRFAICYRNEWMIKKSDYVVVYVEGCCGGAYKYMQLAERKKRIVINLASKKP